MANDLGPLAELAGELRDGSITASAAKVRARELGASGQVGPQIVIGLAEASREATEQVGWRTTLPMAELAFEAVDSAHSVRPDDPAVAEALVFTASELIEILHFGLFELGDIRLFLRAQSLADRALPISEKFGFEKLEGLVSLRLGTLILDAYTANRTQAGWQVQLNNWIARALQVNDPELQMLVSSQLGSAGEPDPDKPPARFPDPLDALATAERSIRAALPLIVPERRGRALKALGQLLQWRGVFGGERDNAEVKAVLEQALQELDPADTQAQTAVVVMLQQLSRDQAGTAGVAVAVDEGLLRQLENELDAFVEANGELAAWDAIAQAASSLQDLDVERGLALLDGHRQLGQVWADEDHLSRHYEIELTLFARAYRPPGSAAAWDGGFDTAMEAARASLTDASTAEGARTAAAAIITVMLASTKLDREGEALDLTDDLFALDTVLWANSAEAAQMLFAGLLRGEGVNCMRSDEYTAAGDYYQRAADIFRELGFGVAMTTCLNYLVDVVVAGTEHRDELTAWLATYSLHCELVAPNSAPTATHRLAATLLASQVSNGTSPEVVHLLLQVAKGRRFAAMLATGTRDYALDGRVQHHLDLESTAEKGLPADADILRPIPFDAALGEDDLLTAWVNEFEVGPAETPSDKVANLQRTCEQLLQATMTPRVWPPVLRLSEVRELLSDDTALLELFEGTWTDGGLASWQFLLARDFEHVAVGSEQFPTATVRASWQGRSVEMPPSGFVVGELRRELQKDPGPLDVSPAAAELLASGATRYARVVDQAREQLKAAGIHKLIVVPHGSSRFVPIHLVGSDGHALADDWNIRYLLSIGQLKTSSERPSRSGVGVFGLTYADQPSLPPLDDSRVEAEAIASVCGTTAQIDADATEPAFMEALTTCRYVHLRAHGRLYVDAPSFHTVFLHPSEGFDGRLRAFEVPGLDLSGLDLVTLSACETALTRVDRSDNPRGLPAALVLAGARAVIGTLWQVLASASTYFFTELYRDLLANGGDVSSSFVVAQRATRQAFPQYRDWGAFYLIGDC